MLESTHIRLIRNIAILNFNKRISQGKTTKAFLAFLKESIEKRTIQAFKRDEWESVFDFLEGHLNTLSEYSEMESWPVMFDQFVEWARAKPEYKDMK